MLAVRFYKAGEDGPEGWPSEIRSHPDGIPAPDGFELLTQEELDVRRAVRKETHAAWLRGQVEVTKAQQRLQDKRLKKDAVKREACRRILQNLGMEYPNESDVFHVVQMVTKQINMLQRETELNAKSSTTAAEKAELKEIKNFFGFVQKVRKHSNDLEKSVDDTDNPDLSQGWPEE
jgi:hypothetical protein